MASAKGACLNHIARESTDVKRLSRFYKEVVIPSIFLPVLFLFCYTRIWVHIGKGELGLRILKPIFGFEQVESPKFGVEVIWLKLGSSLCLHLIERNPDSKLPESPWTATSAVADPSNLPRGHHICIYVPNFDSFLQNLKEKGIEVYEKTLPDGKTKQAFFFDPDGNGLEISSQCPEL